MKKLIILQLLLAAHSSFSIEQNQAHTSAESHDVAAFIQRLDSLREDANIPGLSVAVVEDHAIVLAAGLGYADIEGGIPATAETAYDIASVAKPLSAVVALRLVETGVLDLDRPLVDYSEWTDFCTDFSQQPSIFAQALRSQPPKPCASTLAVSYGYGGAWHPVLVQPHPLLLGIAPDHGRR